MAFVHGGAPVKLFGLSVYKYLCGDDPSSISVKITEVSSRSLLQQVYIIFVYIYIVIL